MLALTKHLQAWEILDFYTGTPQSERKATSGHLRRLIDPQGQMMGMTVLVILVAGYLFPCIVCMPFAEEPSSNGLLHLLDVPLGILLHGLCDFTLRARSYFELSLFGT